MSTSFPNEWDHSCELAWDGISSLPFSLKRKQDGSIRVSKLKEPFATKETAKFGIGSELKFVAGLPVRQLSLKEVKKVMLAAPKPVLMVFHSYNDNLTDNGSFITETSDSGSFEYNLENISSADTSSSAGHVSKTTKLEKKTGSRLKLAFRRMNDLLNRPVRQSALSISSDKSIIV